MLTVICYGYGDGDMLHVTVTRTYKATVTNASMRVVTRMVTL